MTQPFAIVLDVHTRILNRHRVFELSFGGGSMLLYASSSASRGFVPAAVLPAEDAGATMAFLFAVASALDVRPIAFDRAPRTTPTEIGLIFEGSHVDDEDHEWLAYKLSLASTSEAFFRVCPTRRVAYLEERVPCDPAAFFERLCDAVLQPNAPADWSTERPIVPDLEWLVDDIPLAHDVVPEPVAVRPPHVRWVGDNLVAVDADGRRLMLIKPQIRPLFSADHIFAIRAIDDRDVLVHYRNQDAEGYALVSVPSGTVKQVDGPVPSSPGWTSEIEVEDTPDGLRILARGAHVTFAGVRGMWRAVSPRYVVTRLDAYYLLDGLEQRGWEIAPSSRWAAFELNDGATRLAFATFGGRLFTAQLDRRHLDGGLPRTSRPVATEHFWHGVDADYVTVAGIHTDLSVTRLARAFGLDRDALAARLEKRLAQFLSCYLPREWTVETVERARFDLAPAWAAALRRGVALDVVQAAAERLAADLIRRRLFDTSFVNLLVRGGRPLDRDDLEAFEMCVDQATAAFIAAVPVDDTDEDLNAQVELQLRQASDSLRLLAYESVEVEPDSWENVRWRIDRIGQLANMKAPALVGTTELLHLARDVKALA